MATSRRSQLAGVSMRHQASMLTTYGNRVVAVDSRIEKVNSATSERLKLATISALASTLLSSSPNHGVPWRSSRANARGNRPSCAGASGVCACSITQPLSAPKQDTVATAARPSPAVGPHRRRAASTIGAAEWCSTSAGSRPITTVQASMVASPAISMPITVARGTVRCGSRTTPVGTVAASSPSSAHSVSAATEVVTSSSGAPLGLNGR